MIGFSYAYAILKNFEPTGRNTVGSADPATRWETFSLNPQAWSSRINRILPKDEFDTTVVKPKKKNFDSHKSICNWSIL